MAQQFARDPLPPDGWLSSFSMTGSLLEILNRFEGCPAPPGRTDVKQWKNPTLQTIALEYNGVAYYIPRSKFGSDRDHEDAMAVGLYSDESFVYWLMNAWANDTSAERERGLWFVGPFMWRLAEALPRCCNRHTGPAVRVLHAGADSPKVMRDAFADYEHQMAEGSVFNFRSFASFTRGSKTNRVFIHGPSIVLFCLNIEAFDVDDLSMVRLRGRRPEKEVLCLPSQSFTVLHPPLQAESNVIAYITKGTQRTISLTEATARLPGQQPPPQQRDPSVTSACAATEQRDPSVAKLNSGVSEEELQSQKQIELIREKWP